jgi:hypothetical protein
VLQASLKNPTLEGWESANIRDTVWMSKTSRKALFARLSTLLILSYAYTSFLKNKLVLLLLNELTYK